MKHVHAMLASNTDAGYPDINLIDMRLKKYKFIFKSNFSTFLTNIFQVFVRHSIGGVGSSVHLGSTG